MKKLILLTVMLATLVAGAFGADFSANLTAGYESQYIFRGLKQANGIGTADLTTTVADRYSFELLAIAPLAPNFRLGSLQEVDATIKYSVPVQNAYFDVGGVLYMFPGSKVQLKQTEYSTEAFVGLRYKAFLNPGVAAYYNPNLKRWTFEGKLNQPIHLTQKLALVPSAVAGYVTALDAVPEANKAVTQSYRYAGGSLDLVYTFNKSAAISVGERYVVADNVVWTHHTWTGATLQFRF